MSAEVKSAPQAESYVKYYIAGLVVVGIIIAVVIVYGKRSGFLIGQFKSDTSGDWSMRKEIAKLEERQKTLLAKLNK